MTNKEPHAGSEPVRTRSDLGRRAALRRQQLGLTREEVAARAAASPGFLKYVEESASDPGIGFMLRLASALDTTVSELVGGRWSCRRASAGRGAARGTGSQSR